jgi:hypothetical protein
MKKLAVVLALAVSGFVNGQWHNSKLDDLILIPNFDREYPHLEKADSIVKIGLPDSIFYDKMDELLDMRYGLVIGDEYQIEFNVVMTNGDISLMIITKAYEGYLLIDTYLSNLEASFQSGKLKDEVEEAFFIIDNND